MDVYYIIPNQLKENCMEQAALIRAFLEKKGKKCYIQAAVKEHGGTPNLDSGQAEPNEAENVRFPRSHRYTFAKQVPEDVQVVLVLGGDGTLLQASRDLVERDLPLLGINMGTLGYLAEIEVGNVEQALDRLLGGDYSIEERMMLSGSVRRGEELLLEDIALNDIVIARRGRLRVVDFNIYVNGAFLCAYRADGIILSTATGSTGYSLSAGGPIVSPDARLMLMTPVAPHTINSRPIVLPDHVEVTVVVGGGSLSGEDGAEVIFDGDTSLGLCPGDRIIVSRSKRRTRLVKINNTSFVETLRKKMN